jgi:4-cresol dehydrogenase (hydroxylating) flavoprotein subunit
MSATLPSGLSEGSLDAALEEFRGALGEEAVITDEAAVREFRDPFWPADDDTYAPSVVVMPETTEQVQEVVRIANRHAVPVWTHSTGRNNGYGGPAPRVGGSVTISLRNMNRVLEINEELGFAVVEPGVRWFDLYDALKAGGHALMLSIPDLGWGSVIGNSLDNGVSYLPYGKDFAAPCGMEVVLADGTLLRTGVGAQEGNPSWHLYKRGLGPVLDPLFIQSNYGIVTRMGVHLMPRPEVYSALMLRLWGTEDIGPAVDIVRDLQLKDVLQGVPTIGSGVGIASQMTPRSQWYDGEDPLPDEIHERIGRELGLGRWTMRFGLWGDEDMVDVRLAKIRRAFEAIPGAEILENRYTGEQIAAEDIAPHEKVLAGIPNLEVNTMTGWYGGEEGGHIGFSPVIPLTGDSFTEVYELLRGLVEEEARLDFIAGSLVINNRSLVMVAMLLFDTKDAEQTRRAYDVAKRLAVEAGKRGYGEYRAHLDFMDLTADQYGFNDHAYRRFCEKIKDAVDPNGILSPGRHGIWPAGMREGR